MTGMAYVFLPRLLLVWGMTGATILVAVVLPLLIARSMRRGHTFVSEEAVTQTRGEVIRKQIRFEEARGDPCALQRQDGWRPQ